MKFTSIPFGAALLFGLAGVLYFTMIAVSFSPAGSGEDRIGQGFELLFLAAGLWLTLAFLLLVGGVNGSMPRWSAILSAFLLPISGIAAVVALDSVSRGISGAIIVPGLLAPLIALYGLWARLPKLQTELPATLTSAVVWTVTFILSIGSLILAIWI